MPSDIQKVFDFTTYLESFKKIERFVGQYFWRDYPSPKKYESDADHTWRMSMMLIGLERHLTQPIDFKKTMKMVLIHDIPEIIAGDADPLGSQGTGQDSHIYNKEAAKKKHEREAEAAKIIFAKLPTQDGDELLALWHEFEAQSSYEARVVKAIDKLEGKLQAFEYTNGTMFKEHFDFTMKYGTHTYSADPATEEFGSILLAALEKNYTEFKK